MNFNKFEISISKVEIRSLNWNCRGGFRSRVKTPRESRRERHLSILLWREGVDEFRIASLSTRFPRRLRRKFWKYWTTLEESDGVNLVAFFYNCGSVGCGTLLMHRRTQRNVQIPISPYVYFVRYKSNLRRTTFFGYLKVNPPLRKIGARDSGLEIQG